MTKRYLFGMAMFVTTSCVPHGADLSAPRPAAPVDDHQLLRKLALKDPLGQPAPLPAPAAAAAAAATILPPPFQIADAAGEDAQRALQCLTAAVYYEARSEPLDGQRAVAQVVLNRVRDRAFPDSVCKVVYQRPARGTGCQFSFVCDGSTARPVDRRAWLESSAVAQAALAGSVYAPVGSANHYHTTAVNPWWASSLTRIGLVGSHIFYRWGDSLGRALSFRQAYAGAEALPDLAVAETMPGDEMPADLVRYGARSVEAGVRVHRNALPRGPEPAATRTSFGVTVHYGGSSEPEADEVELTR